VVHDNASSEIHSGDLRRRLRVRRRALRVLGRAGNHGQLSLPRLPEGRRGGILADRGGEPRRVPGDVRRTQHPQHRRGERQHRPPAFCPQCGTPLYASSSARPDFIGIRAGSLDDPSWFQPSADVWTDSAQPWDVMDPGVVKFAKGRRRGG